MRRILLAACLLAAGCAVANTSMLDDRTAIIAGRGSAYSDTGMVIRKILLEAATEAQARGFTHFAIVDSANASTTAHVTTPTTTDTSISGTTRCTGSFCSGEFDGESTTYGGQSFSFDKPGADLMVRFLKAEEVHPGMQVWEASRVIAAQAKK